MNIYLDLFNLIHQYVFGGATLTANTDLVCTLVATIGCVALVAMPFWVVFRAISYLC